MTRVREPLLRVRERVVFTPKWVGPIEGFTRNFATDNEWRVQPDMDASDLYQEGWLLFNKLRCKYPRVVDPPHFMALYRTALWRHTTSLANLRTKVRQTVLPSRGGEGDVDAGVALDELLADAEIRMMLADAPEVVQTLIEQIGSGCTLPQRHKAGKDGVREKTSHFVSRVAGAYSLDVYDFVRSWIKGDKPHVNL